MNDDEAPPPVEATLGGELLLEGLLPKTYTKIKAEISSPPKPSPSPPKPSSSTPPLTKAFPKTSQFKKQMAEVEVKEAWVPKGKRTVQFIDDDDERLSKPRTDPVVFKSPNKPETSTKRDSNNNSKNLSPGLSRFGRLWITLSSWTNPDSVDWLKGFDIKHFHVAPTTATQLEKTDAGEGQVRGDSDDGEEGDPYLPPIDSITLASSRRNAFKQLLYPQYVLPLWMS